MKDLGPTNMILGMKISRTQNGILLSLSHSIKRMFHKFNFYNSKSISIPSNSSIALENTGELVFQL